MNRKRALLFTITVVLALCVACGAWLHVQKQQYAHDRSLIDALVHNDIRQALVLVNAEADPNTRFAPSPTPTFQLLLDQLLHRKSPPANDSPTAFMLACGTSWNSPHVVGVPHPTVQESPPLFNAMLVHRAHIHAKAFDGSTALHFACENGRLHTVEMLLQRGAYINAQNERGETPLMSALSSRNTSVILLVLSHGANPNVQDVNGDTALLWAVLCETDKTTISQMLAHGADPKIPAMYGETPLSEAKRAGFFDIVELMQRAGKDAPPAANHR